MLAFCRVFETSLSCSVPKKIYFYLKIKLIVCENACTRKSYTDYSKR